MKELRTDKITYRRANAKRGHFFNRTPHIAMTENRPRTLRVYPCGDEGTGKTSLMNAVTSDPSPDPFTVRRVDAGVSEWTKEASGDAVVFSDLNLKFLRDSVDSFYAKGDLFLVVFDITKSVTFQSVTDWVSRIRRVNKCAKLFLIGNMCDLESERAVSRDEADAVKQNIGADLYIEVSAKSCANIDELKRHLKEFLCHRLSELESEEASFQIPANVSANRQINQQRSICGVS